MFFKNLIEAATCVVEIQNIFPKVTLVLLRIGPDLGDVFFTI